MDNDQPDTRAPEVPAWHASATRQRDGRWNLYAGQGTAPGAMTYRGQFDSLMDAARAARERFGCDLEQTA